MTLIDSRCCLAERLGSEPSCSRFTRVVQYLRRDERKTGNLPLTR
jgi:hypothetical protein